MLGILLLTEVDLKVGDFCHFCTRTTWCYVFSFIVGQVKSKDAWFSWGGRAVLPKLQAWGGSSWWICLLPHQMSLPHFHWHLLFAGKWFQGGPISSPLVSPDSLITTQNHVAIGHSSGPKIMLCSPWKSWLRANRFHECKSGTKH